MSKRFSRELRLLRQEKGPVQEQPALRWECGNPLPDALLLPEFSRMHEKDLLYHPFQRF